MRDGVRKVKRRQGCVVGISGGVDSSVALGLCVGAFGPDRVIAIMMPEQDSNGVMANELGGQSTGGLGGLLAAGVGVAVLRVKS